jgi:integrase
MRHLWSSHLRGNWRGRQTVIEILEDVLCFREWRSQSGVGPAIINMEVGVIRRMLKRARRWHQFGADIRPLKEPRSIGRALTYEEKLRLLRAAGQNEEWQRAEAAMSLALCTTMRGCEIKRLQWRDIDFLNRAILVRNEQDGRRRTIDSDERRNPRDRHAATGSRQGTQRYRSAALRLPSL